MALEKFLRGIVLAGVFALPFLALYVANSLFFPFITGKNFAFRIIVEIIAGAWLCLALIKSEYRPKRSWLLWGFAGFVILIGISDIFGTYPFKSFWSNYERMEGWVTLAHLFVYFVVAVSVLNTERLWKAWWHTSFAVSLIVACIGLFQLAGLVQINQGNIRVDARLGNATYAAIYMLFHVFMAALFLARAWIEKRSERILYVSYYGAIIALDSLILFFTATRGAILGLLGGALLSTLILIFLAPRSRVAWRAGVLVAGFLVLAGGFWLVRDQAWVHRIEPLHRLATIHTEGFPIARLMNVQMAWKGVQERPILGWGQENYAAVFDKHYDPGMYAQEQWFDRTHNIIFDWLIAGGILGLLAYLSLYLFSLLMIWRSGAFAPYERALLTGLLAGYFFYLIFTFDNITSYILFVSLLAYIATRAYGMESASKSNGPVDPKMLPILSAGALIIVGIVMWYVNADMIRANRTLIRAISPQTEGPARNLELFKEALSYPRGADQEIREQLAQAAMSVVAVESAPAEVKQGFLTLAVGELQQQMKDAPQNARPPFFLGILLDRVGAYADAKVVLEQTLALTPRKQGILFELGLNAFARGANEEALGYFKQAYELEPAYQEARTFYASALIRLNRDAEADEVLKPLIEANDLGDERVAAAYIERKQFNKLIPIWTGYIAKHPEQERARMLLAEAYYATGNVAKTIEILEALKRDIPSTSAQIDPILTQLRSGKSL